MADSVNLGTVHVSLEMRLQKFRDGIRDGKRDLAGFEGAMKRTAENMTNLGKKMTVGLTLPLAALGKQAVDTAVRFDSLKRGLIAVEGSSAQAEKALAKLKEIAKLPGLGLEEAQAGYIRLRSVKLNADLAERSLMAFGNALASVGRGKAELDGINLALTQIVGKGKVTAEEINQIAERLPQVRDLMKQAFGTADTEALQKRGLAPEQFIEAIVSQLEKLPKVTSGAQVAFENFSDSLKLFQESIGQAILPTLTRAMDALKPKIDAATEWFNGLSDSGKDAVTGIGVALGAGGPLMLALGGILSKFAEIAKNPVFRAFFIPGAVAAGGAAAFKVAEDKGFFDWLARILPGGGGTTGLVTSGRQTLPDLRNPQAALSAAARVRMRNMVYDPFTGKVRPFIKPDSSPIPIPPPAPISEEELKRQRELLTANKDLLAELGGEEARIMRESQRMLNRGLRPDLVRRWITQQMAPILKKRNEIMMGNVLRQGKEEAHSLPRIGPAIPNLGAFARDFGMRPGRPDMMGALQAERFAAFLQNRPANVTPQGGLSIFSAAALGAGTDAFAKKFAPGEGLRTRDIEMKAEPVLKELSFNLGQEFGNNFAMEMGRAFGDMFAKVFGDGNPLSRALGRTLSRLVDDVMYTLAQRAFGDKLMLSIFGGAGGLAGTGAGLGGVAGGAMFGKLGMGSAAGAGAKAGSAFGAAFAAKAAIAIAGVFAVGAGLNALLGGRGRFNVNTIGSQIFPQAPSLGSAMAAGGYGSQWTMHLHNPVFNKDIDIDRFMTRASQHVDRRLRSR